MANIDTAFKECFETREMNDKCNAGVPLLKKEWFTNKLKLLKVDESPWDLINFYKSLPMELQIHQPEHYIDSIAHLRERFLFAYLLENKHNYGYVYFAMTTSSFHDYTGLNALKEGIVSGI